MIKPVTFVTFSTLLNNMETKRKGARSLKDIPADVLNQLNGGLIQSVNLTEWLAVDQELLLKSVLPEHYVVACLSNIKLLEKRSTMQLIRQIGETLLVEANKKKDTDLFMQLKNHLSDNVRCWAAYMVGLDESMTVQEKLIVIKDFAADNNFGVREIAWMAMREDISNHIEVVIPILQEWTKDDNSNTRRFASESIRPNGVWSKHIEKLKQNPEIALPILEALKSDKERYVQDSVANWLNDASKTQPDFVIELTTRWTNDGASKETKYIIKKALRTINKEK